MIPILLNINDSLVEIDQEDGLDLIRFISFITEGLVFKVRINPKAINLLEIEG